MIDLKDMRERATEGLAIAEKATKGPLVPWHDSERPRGYSVCATDADGLGDVDIADTLTKEDAAFFADARTRAPDAYRDVIALCDELEDAMSTLDVVHCALNDAGMPPAPMFDRVRALVAERDALRAERDEARLNALAAVEETVKTFERETNWTMVIVKQRDAARAERDAALLKSRIIEDGAIEMRADIDRWRPVVDAAIVWRDRFNPRTDPDEDENALCEAVNRLYPEDRAGWKARSEAVREILKRRRESETCGAQHFFVEWPEAPPCTIGKGHAGPHGNGCFQWGMSQGPLRQDPHDE